MKKPKDEAWVDGIPYEVLETAQRELAQAKRDLRWFLGLIVTPNGQQHRLEEPFHTNEDNNAFWRRIDRCRRYLKESKR